MSRHCGNSSRAYPTLGGSAPTRSSANILVTRAGSTTVSVVTSEGRGAGVVVVFVTPEGCSAGVVVVVGVTESVVVVVVADVVVATGSVVVVVAVDVVVVSATARSPSAMLGEQAGAATSVRTIAARHTPARVFSLRRPHLIDVSIGGTVPELELEPRCPPVPCPSRVV